MMSFFYKFSNQKSHELIFLAILVIIFSFLRIPSIIEPNWYGDEGIYQVIGMALSDGRLLYKEIWDNKPPLLYLIYAFVNGDQFSVRLLSTFVGIGTVITFYFVAKKLFSQTLSILISTIIFALIFATPYLEGNIANAENFMILPILLALYILLNDHLTTKSYIYSGLLLSVAFLIKIVGLFDFIAFLTILFVIRYHNGNLNILYKSFKQSIKNRDIKLFKNELAYILFFILPILIVSLFFLVNGAFIDYIKAVYLQNIGYVGYGNTRFFPMSFLIFKFLILCIAVSAVIFYRKKLSKTEIVILLWLAFSLFNTYFSQRPYTHYLLVSLPSFCLLVGLISENRKKSFFYAGMVLLVLYVIYSSFSPYKKLLPYYNNYIDFLQGNKDVSSYQSFFDNITPRDYRLAEFIKLKTRKDENVFLWSDSGQIYALSNKLPVGKYIVSYHITFYKDALSETKKNIEDKKPKYIISTKKSPELAELLGSYSFTYSIEGANIYERSD